MIEMNLGGGCDVDQLRNVRRWLRLGDLGRARLLSPTYVERAIGRKCNHHDSGNTPRDVVCGLNEMPSNSRLPLACAP
jgi:hypothetical protein